MAALLLKELQRRAVRMAQRHVAVAQSMRTEVRDAHSAPAIEREPLSSSPPNESAKQTKQERATRTLLKRHIEYRPQSWRGYNG